MEELSKEEYYKLHTSNLRPLKISIEIDKFFEDIKTINFQQWGDLHLEFPRFAFALVNQDGVIKDDDPACYPLDRYNFIQEYPQYKMSALSYATKSSGTRRRPLRRRRRRHRRQRGRSGRRS